MNLPMPKVLFTAHWDWVLYQFRLPLAAALQEHGYDVALVCPSGRYIEKIEKSGFRWIRWDVQRRSMNPFREVQSIARLRRIYTRELPDIVHHFTIKPNLYGTLAVQTLGRKQACVINTFSGLGFLFSDKPQAKLMAYLITPLLRTVSHNSSVWTAFQNRENMETLCSHGIVPPDRALLIQSSGVNINVFHPDGKLERSHPPKVLFAGRLLWDKGIREFVTAAEILHSDGIAAEFWIAGERDPGNPQCIPTDVFQAWKQSSALRWLGHVEHMPELLREVDIAVLPSYHEGVPRFLLEAAASGLPVVATDIEGCRTVVRHRENGILVPVRDAKALADAIAALVRNPQVRQEMGRVSREIAVRDFDEQKILQQWLEFYERVSQSLKSS